ncbi:four helix bundle protein [Maribellus mangrovi]|uniref:four helix bundle protein n=1 Tax=Maribellus mangrovi TaxID=3133146 RepID=UPI0030EEA65F
MKLEDLEIYQLSMEVGDEVWETVREWDNLAKYSMGVQVIKSADSIAANISEGYGRFHFKDRKNFMFYARGSHSETKTWLIKARNRNIISEEFFNAEIVKLDKLGVKMNNYIKILDKQS